MSKTEDIELQEQLLDSSPPSTPFTPSESTDPFDSANELPDDDEGEIIHRGHTVHLHSLNWRRSKILRAQIGLCFLLFALDGAADQTVGTLMPFLVDYYHTTQTHISIVFVLQFVGYIISAFSNEILHRLFGKRGTLICAALGMATCFLINSVVENLNVYIFVHFFYGMGAGFSSASVNVYISTLVNHNEIMGILHGCYGIGSVMSPPVVSWVLVHWGYRVYYGILGWVGVVSAVVVWFVFKDETKWKYDYLTSKDHKGDTIKKNVFSLVFDPVILCFCFYLFFYVGAEIATGSWLLTYLRETKGMEQMDAAIVVSWFWIGLTAGRIGLGFVTRLFPGEYHANLTYSVLSWITFTILTIFAWFYHGEHFPILSKAMVFITGIFVGPLFPTASVVLVKILPVDQHVSGLGVASSLGGSGSAVIPFFVGLFARWFGFQYLLIIISTTLLAYSVVWIMIKPVAEKRSSYKF